MDAQEFRNLQEAYMEVYEERDTLHPLWETKRQDKKAQKERNELISAKQKRKEDRERNRNPLFGPSEKMTKTQREETDLYDIILSHLLDEGYAETPESAHKIMVNMSEEWRESIVEARKKVKIDTQKPIEYKIADIGPGKKEYNVKTSKGWKEEVEPDPFGRPGGKHGGVRKGGGYEKGYEAMKKKIKELEDKK